MTRDKIVGRVLHGVDAVVFRPDGKVLMLARDPQKEDFETGWEFVKGALQEGEDHMTASLREIREEAGITVEYMATLLPIFRVDARYRKKPHYDFVEKRATVSIYKCGEVRIDSAEHVDWAWMTLPEAIEVVWVENGREILEAAWATFTNLQGSPSESAE